MGWRNPLLPMGRGVSPLLAFRLVGVRPSVVVCRAGVSYACWSPPPRPEEVVAEEAGATLCGCPVSTRGATAASRPRAESPPPPPRPPPWAEEEEEEEGAVAVVRGAEAAGEVRPVDPLLRRPRRRDLLPPLVFETGDGEGEGLRLPLLLLLRPPPRRPVIVSRAPFGGNPADC